MKGVRKKYPKAKDGLPKTAMTVKMYAEKAGYAVGHIYKLYQQGKVVIVDFCGINFVLPD